MCECVFHLAVVLFSPCIDAFLVVKRSEHMSVQECTKAFHCTKLCKTLETNGRSVTKKKRLPFFASAFEDFTRRH